MFKLLAAANHEKWPSEEFEFKLAQLPATMITPILLYTNWEDQQARILNKLLIKKQMSLFKTNYNLYDIKRNEFNCPYINDDFHFNTSHTKGIVVCLASNEGPVGIDIELMDSKTKYFPLDLFSHQERSHLELSLNYSNEFYRLFTRKEAFMKLSGEGVFMNVMENSVINDEIEFNNQVYYFNTILLSNNYMLSYVLNNKMYKFEMDWVNNF
jgi:4'-phosphopantetheinyl transferase